MTTYMNHMQKSVAQMSTRCKLEEQTKSGHRGWGKKTVRKSREKQTASLSGFCAIVRSVGARSKEAQHHSQEDCDEQRNDDR